MNLNRAYSLLDVKSVDTGREFVTIKGIASTPTPDRMGDIVDPMGAMFKTPMPLLWQHDTKAPVGLVTFARPNKDGIPFTAEMPIITEPGTLKDRVDEAIQSVKHGLVAAVSIGFRVVNDAVEYIGATGGLKFLEWEWYELSLVTIPANAEATIATVKSIDRKVAPPNDGREALLKVARKSHDPKVVSSARADLPLAAIGGVKALSGKGPAMNIREQKQQYESTFAAKDAVRTKMMEESAEKGETLDAEQSKQYDDLTNECDQILAHLKRLDVMEKSELARARPVAGASNDEATQSRSPSEPIVIGLEKKLPPGIGVIRMALCKLQAEKDHITPDEVAKRMYPDMHAMAKGLEAERFAGGMRNILIAKTAVPAGTTTDTTWAKPLVQVNTYLGDFVEYLRPFSILGKFGMNGVPDLKRVPFNVSINGQTSGGAGYWVGEGAAKPLTKFDFTKTYLSWYKLAAIVAVTDELIRFGNPGTEQLLRDSLRDAIVAKMDTSFIDPTFAAVTGVNPASITNGVTAITPSGTTAAALRADIAKMWANWQAVNLDAATPVYIMDSQTAIRLASMRTTLESSKQFPDLSYKGGELDGVPVIVSNYTGHATAGGTLVLVNADDIYLADDGQVTIDASREASLVMDTAPSMTSATPTGQSVVSMFQTNSLAIRGERYINWAKRRTFAVQMINPTAYA